MLGTYIGGQAFTFPVQREPLTHKAAVYYHQQLALNEDQGIDLTQSPGRDSPGSSSGSAGSGSRHSTASLDSGRASSYHTQTSSSTRGGCGSGSGGGSGPLSSPRCSVSSCSIGSVDRMSQRSVSVTHPTKIYHPFVRSPINFRTMKLSAIGYVNYASKSIRNYFRRPAMICRQSAE